MSVSGACGNRASAGICPERCARGRPCWERNEGVVTCRRPPLLPRYNNFMAITSRVAEPLPHAGVILAIDYGRKRLGLALYGAHGVTSHPFATVTRTNPWRVSRGPERV